MKSGNSIPCECMTNQRSELPANFHWRPYSKSFLKTFVIVKMDVLLDDRTQLALNSLLQLAFPALSMKGASPCASYFLT